MTYKYDIRDYMKLYSDFASDKECKDTIKLLKKNNWSKHSYVDANRENVRTQYENDLSITIGEGEFFDEQNNRIWNYIHDYILNHINQPTLDCWHGYTRIRYNRYNKGEEMRNHVDHISSIFDGHTKGIPFLTVLGSLNDNYEGGKLLFFNDIEVPMPTGSIIIFPSIFIYPHLVTPVTKGTRYSFVSWIW